MTIYRPSALLRENQLTGAPFLVHLLKGETNFYRQVSNGYHGNAFGTETGFCSRARIMVRGMVLEAGGGQAPQCRAYGFPHEPHRACRALPSPSDRITLETHVMDVVNLIKYNDMRDVVLVGDRLRGDCPDGGRRAHPAMPPPYRLSHAMVPKPGECAMDLIPNDESRAACPPGAP